MNTHPSIEKGLSLQKEGRLLEARECFIGSLRDHPNDVVALYSLSSIECQFGQYKRALECIDQALVIQPLFPPSLLAKSIILTHLDHPEQALQFALLAKEKDAELSGVEGQIQSCQKRIELKKAGQPEAHFSEIDQLNAQALKAQDRGDIATASDLFYKVLSLDTNNFVALYSLGVIMSKSHRLPEAADFLRRACAAAPLNAMARFAMGSVLQQSGLYEDALREFDQAIAIDPNYVEPYTNKAHLLHTIGQQKNALLTLDQALQVRPDDTKLLCNKGYILTEFKENLTAAKTFHEVLIREPDYEYARGLYTFAKMHACDWSDFEANHTEVMQRLKEGQRVINPLAFAAISDDVELFQTCTSIFGRHRFPAAHKQFWNGESYRHRRTRVAFISADFREHPVGYLLIGLIEKLRDFGLETYAVSLGINDGSNLLKRYRIGFNHFLDCSDKTSEEIARIMRGLEIDVAIDLSGYTSGSRLDILSYKPAPVQASYLGFPGTLSLPYIDYLIADAITAPEAFEASYSEEVLRLPSCYLPRDCDVPISAAQSTRESHGLPKDGPVLCSFNHAFKITPDIFNVWLELLSETPGAVLWLAESNKEVEASLKGYAQRQGIDPSRLIFAKRVPSISDHLERYRHADIFLDTFPYNGHTTVSDALFAGVPVVTLMGKSFASRVAGSLLNDLNLATWTTTNLSDYKGLAKQLLSISPQAKEFLHSQRLKASWPFQAEALARNFSGLGFH